MRRPHRALRRRTNARSRRGSVPALGGPVTAAVSVSQCTNCCVGSVAVGGPSQDGSHYKLLRRRCMRDAMTPPRGEKRRDPRCAVCEALPRAAKMVSRTTPTMWRLPATRSGAPDCLVARCCHPCSAVLAIPPPGPDGWARPNLSLPPHQVLWPDSHREFMPPALWPAAAALLPCCPARSKLRVLSLSPRTGPKK